MAENAGAPHLPDPDCVVKVGEGRGFIIQQRVKLRRPRGLSRNIHLMPSVPFVDYRLVVTAAHCLPKLPSSHAAAFGSDRTYALLGTSDGSKKNILTECLFVNPVADIAVLGAPDAQVYEEAPGYDELTGKAPFLRISNARDGIGWVLSLDCQWVQTTLDLSPSNSDGRTWWLEIGPTDNGMSGSPILNDAGRAIGVVAVGAQTVSKGGHRKDHELSGPQPILFQDLPPWLLS